MEQRLYSNDFAHAFSKLLEKTGVSCYKISEYSHVDEAYLSRLRNGEKHNPSAETILKIALAVAHCSPKVTIHDIETFLNSVGRSLHI